MSYAHVISFPINTMYGCADLDCWKQEAEQEVAELLEWMGASQEHESGDELDEEAYEIRRGLSQPWESPSMEAAMLQALSRFEQATQKECREILDCVNHEEGEEDEVMRTLKLPFLRSILKMYKEAGIFHK